MIARQYSYKRELAKKESIIIPKEEESKKEDVTESKSMKNENEENIVKNGKVKEIEKEIK